MVLQVIAVLFFSAALLLALVFGYAWPFGALLNGINVRLLPSVHGVVERNLPAGFWDSFFAPALGLPAWIPFLATALALVFIAALRRR